MGNSELDIKLSYEDADYYDYKNLKNNDKKIIDILRNVKSQLLNEDEVNEYLASLTIGNTTKEMLKEFIMPFILFLRSKIDVVENEKIINIIDEYTEEEFKALLTAARQVEQNRNENKPT